jgi:hypothetical protein
MRILFVDDAGVQRSFQPDCTLREQHELVAEVTRRPVEKGADVALHVKQLPRVVTPELLVTNTPIEAPDGVSGTFGPIRLERRWREVTKTATVKGAPPYKIQFSLIELQFGGEKVEVTPGTVVEQVESVSVSGVLTFASEFDRVKDAWDLFDRLMQRATVCKLQTEVGIVPDVFVARVSLPKEANDAGLFTVEFQQVKFASVTTEIVVPVAEKRGEKKKSQGAQGGGYQLDAEQASLAKGLGL